MGPETETEPERETAARRSLAFFAVALVAAAAGLLLLVLDDDSSDPARDAPVRTVGPADGVSVEAYIEARQAALREAAGRHLAVVSLTGYETPDAVVELTPADADVRAVLVALPGDGGRAAGDVAAAVALAVDEAESQIEEIEPLIPTVDDPEFAEFYRDEVERYRRVLEARDRDDVVFGFVVDARAPDLRAIASRPGVRLVDIAEGDLAPDVDYRGLLPDEAITTGDPGFRR